MIPIKGFLSLYSYATPLPCPSILPLIFNRFYPSLRSLSAWSTMVIPRWNWCMPYTGSMSYWQSPCPLQCLWFGSTNRMISKGLHPHMPSWYVLPLPLEHEIEAELCFCIDISVDAHGCCSAERAESSAAWRCAVFGGVVYRVFLPRFVLPLLWLSCFTIDISTTGIGTFMTLFYIGIYVVRCAYISGLFPLSFELTIRAMLTELWG